MSVGRRTKEGDYSSALWNGDKARMFGAAINTVNEIWAGMDNDGSGSSSSGDERNVIGDLGRGFCRQDDDDDDDTSEEDPIKIAERALKEEFMMTSESSRVSSANHGAKMVEPPPSLTEQVEVSRRINVRAY